VKRIPSHTLADFVEDGSLLIEIQFIQLSHTPTVALIGAKSTRISGGFRRRSRALVVLAAGRAHQEVSPLRGGPYLPLPALARRETDETFFSHGDPRFSSVTKQTD